MKLRYKSSIINKESDFVWGVYLKKKLQFDLKSITVAVFFVTAFLFVAFSFYMAAFKDDTVYSDRNIASYKTVNYTEHEIKDSSAPIGMRKEYRFEIGDMDNGEDCLIFYVVHSLAEVRFDGNLVYSLTVDNTLGKSPSSNWVVIPLYNSDIGKTATVTVTPVYESVRDREVVFNIGSRYAVFMQRLKTDLPQIILSSLCIIMGILLIVVQLGFIINKRTSSFDMLYLGIFSLLVGIWRITDTRFSPIMFENYTASLGYITLAALFIMPIPLLLFIDERNTGKLCVLLRVAAIVNSVAAIVCLICQVTGIADLRETLNVSHIMLVADMALLIVAALFDARNEAKHRDTMAFISLLVFGCVFDFAYYYIKDTSSGIMFTTIAFLIYTFYMFAKNILNINKKAYVDVKTKLFNRARFDDYINNKIPEWEPIGVMMLDLNGLKHINDTYGHKVGDRVIVKFSELLRKTFGKGEFVCRWGGDEFAVIVRNADREKLEGYYGALHKTAEDYNASGATPKIYFACGYVLSAEYPEVSRSELLTKADARMYSDKQAWYDKQAYANGNVFKQKT